MGHDGEILARGPKQFLGYSDAELDRDAFVGDSWFRTGDVGRLDGNGHLTITDRKKDIIIRGGENISAKEVEDAVVTHPSVAEVAVVSRPDSTWGEQVCAVLITRGDARLTADELRDHVLAAGLATHKVPAEVLIVDDLPRTAAGKVRKADLRQMLRDG
jgi:acyl-CoA synthetase (AMP-forming)/AMP-acid ligase II